MRLIGGCCLLILGIAAATAASRTVTPVTSPTDRFWSLVDSARVRGDECSSLSARVTGSLAKLPPAAIIEFNEELTARLAESYRWDLWAVAYVVNDGASDDTFDYFRAWLLTRGRMRFESAMGDAPLAVEAAPKDERLECEDFLYVAAEAYERVTKQELPLPTIEMPDEPKGKRWTEETIEKVYPGLIARVQSYRR